MSERGNAMGAFLYIQRGRTAFIFFCLAAITVMMPLQAADIPVVICIDDNYSPYCYRSDGRIVGIYPDILAKLLPRIHGYAVKLEPVAWTRGIKLVKSGNAFGIIPPYKRKAERSYMGYSLPILEERIVCVSRKDAFRHGVKFPEGFGKLRIGINSGFLSIRPQDRTGLNIIESYGARVNLLNLARGNLDCYINDELAIGYELGLLRRSGEYRDGRDPEIVTCAELSREEIYLGYTTAYPDRFAFSADFMTKFNRALEEMKSRGEIREIVARYSVKK